MEKIKLGDEGKKEGLLGFARGANALKSMRMLVTTKKLLAR